MTKRIRTCLAAPALLLALLFSLAACAAPAQTEETGDASGTTAPSTESTPFVNDGLEFYDSIDDFLAAVRSQNANRTRAIGGLDCYYYPKTLPENATVKQVRVRDIYVAIEFSLPNSVFPANASDSTQRLTYVWHKDGDPEISLSNYLNVLPAHTQMSYDNRTYYYVPSYGTQQPDDPDKTVWVHCFYFLSEDGEMIQVNIPAIMSAEEAIAYADVQRVAIE